MNSENEILDNRPHGNRILGKYDAYGSSHISGSNSRFVFAMVVFIALYALIAGRLVFLGLEAENANQAQLSDLDTGITTIRPDITDRDGRLLATDIYVQSLYGEPNRIRNVDETAEKLDSVLPNTITPAKIKRLNSDAGFIWLKRELTPRQVREIHNLGLGGIGFRKESQRFYPANNLASHIVGHVDVDNKGIAGLEKYIDGEEFSESLQTNFTSDQQPSAIPLSIDSRVQHAVRDELEQAIARYQAIAAIGIVLDVETSEIIAMSSLPDYNPHNRTEATQRLNLATAGVFEMGSVFKTFTLAMALDSGKVSYFDSIDASNPIRIGKHTIKDFHAKNRVLTVPEVYIYSSNIGVTKLAQTVGLSSHYEFLDRIGVLERIDTELIESAKPLVPPKWGDIASATVSFGHGISISPLHTVVAAAAMINGGNYITPTFFPRSKDEAAQFSKRVISENTSELMKYLFRLNVEKGSGRNAEVPGYFVGGKTGTAEKVENGKYNPDKRFNTFLAAFPMDQPKYVVLVTVDEPKPEEGKLSATAGLNAAPTVSSIIQRIAPTLGVVPRLSESDSMEPTSPHGTKKLIKFTTE